MLSVTLSGVMADELRSMRSKVAAQGNLKWGFALCGVTAMAIHDQARYKTPFSTIVSITCPNKVQTQISCALTIFLAFYG